MLNKESEEKIRIYFIRKNLINIITVLTLITVSLIAVISNNNLFVYIVSFFLLVFVLSISAFMVSQTEKRFRDVEAGYIHYFFDSLSYLIFFIPFLLSSFIINSGDHNFVLRAIYIDVFLLLILVIALWNPFLSVWKRRSLPLQEQKLLSQIFELSKKLNVTITGVRVINWKQVKIANAFQTGLKSYYIFISNFLYENLSYDENLAVIAHEMIHASKNHLRKILTLEEGIFFIVINIFLLAPTFSDSIITQLFLIVIALSILFIGISLFLPFLRRKYEREADVYGAEFTSADALIHALIKIGNLNLAPLSTSKLWNFSHPDINTRVKYLNSLKKGEA